MAWTGVGFGLILSVIGLMVLQHPVGAWSGYFFAIGQLTFISSQYVMAAGYLGLIISLLHSPACARRLNILAPFGRMALTNYILQSLILSTLFFGYGFGLYGQVGRAAQMLVAIAIVAVQIPLSAWWLAHFRFGPLEWVWRSLTYLSWQPMRISR